MVARQSFEKRQFEHRPLYEELADEFCRRITMGRWPVGRPLKTEAMIAAELGVSLGTVRRAFDRLESMNLIDRTPGRGTVVRELDSERRLSRLTNIVDAAGAAVVGEIAIGPVSRVLADEASAMALEVPEGTPLVRVERARSFQNRVFSIETAYHPIEDDEDLPTREALWEQARNYIVSGKIVVGYREYVCAVSRDGPPASTYRFAAPGPVIEARRTLLSFDGTPLEHTLAHCQLDERLRYRIS